MEEGSTLLTFVCVVVDTPAAPCNRFPQTETHSWDVRRMGSPRANHRLPKRLPQASRVSLSDAGMPLQTTDTSDKDTAILTSHRALQDTMEKAEEMFAKGNVQSARKHWDFAANNVAPHAKGLRPGSDGLHGNVRLWRDGISEMTQLARDRCIAQLLSCPHPA